MRVLEIFFAASIVAATGCIALRPVASAFGLVDHPGGRKTHANAVPLVGGLAVFLAALSLAFFVFPSIPSHWGLICAPALLLAVGAIDDTREIRPRFRFGAQIIACLVMMYSADLQLSSVGNLTGLGSIGMWIFAIPMTVFAVVGVINSINMIDGEDGLAGTVVLTALGWYAWMAHLSGAPDLAMIAIILCGALVGFLVFNLRWPWQRRASVFLGDAGSTFLGFVLGWMAIALTQGEDKTIAPICALWVILLPLADTVSLMARRIRRSASPFAADREHIHHLLAAFGFSHSQILLTLLLTSVAFGAIGFFGWRMGVPEPVLFWTFFFLFFSYHFAVKKAWRQLHSTARVGRHASPA